MILRIAQAAFLHAAVVAAVCTKLEDCPQFEALKTNECQPYHHFIARGSTSPYPGHTIETVGKVCDQLNNSTHPTACGYEDVEYRALNGGERWCISAHEGAVNGAAQMQKYTERCPDSHLIVVGFSQGGSVQLDVLGGGGGKLWGCMQESNPAMDISSAPGSRVAAVVVFGATRRSANQTFTFGGGEISDGGAARTAEQNAGLQPYVDAGRLREYCQPHDPICSPHSGNVNMKNHLDYFDKYGNESAAWVVERVRIAAGLPQTQPSAASRILNRDGWHPIANLVILLLVLFALYFVTRRILIWKNSSRYTPVSTTEHA